MIAAVADNGVIGNGPDIPWRIPGEQAVFKRLSTGNVVVMGRATFASIGRPLPNRTTIVLTRDPDWSHDGVLVAHDLAEALELADDLPGDVVIGGGGQVYAEALSFADEQVVTHVHLTPEGDAFYPAFDPSDWVETGREEGEQYDRVWLSRVVVAEGAGAADPAEIWPVYDAVFGDMPPDEWRAELWERHAARDGFRVATVRHEGRVVGFAWGHTGERGQWWSDRVASTLPDEARSWVGGHFELVELAVLPEFRGRGLGRALLRAVTDVPHERLLLQTSEAADDPARRLYASEGWRVLGPGVGEGTVVLGSSRSPA